MPKILKTFKVLKTKQKEFSFLSHSLWITQICRWGDRGWGSDGTGTNLAAVEITFGINAGISLRG
jgi:hypothetical protein